MGEWFGVSVTFAVCLVFLKAVEYLAQRDFLSRLASRKLLHTGIGVVFCVCCLLFSSSDFNSAVWAAAVPGVITVQFALIGLEVLRDEAAVRTMSRSGQPSELLRGPLFYGIAFVGITLLYFRRPVALVALSVLCFGDGLADIVGRRLPIARLPWSPGKSVGGSIAMFVAGFASSIAMLWLYSIAGYWNLQPLIIPTAVVCVVATAVESIPVREIDNLTVPAACCFVGQYLL